MTNPKIEWKLEKIPIKELKDHSKNPRKIDKHNLDHLSNLIEKFGLIDKPIINSDMTIIGGHQRIKILKKSKTKTVDCWVASTLLNETDIDELCIGLNLHRGDWDWSILSTKWEPESLLNYGFTEKQLKAASEEFENIAEILATEEDDFTLEPKKDEDAITKLADLYELGNHRLICGDSTNPEVVQKLLGDAIPILMVTDPPYGVNYDPSWRESEGVKQIRLGKNKANGLVKNDDKVNWSLAWFLFPGSIAYIWHGGKYCSEVQKSLEESEYEIISQIIWIKQHFALSRGDYHWQHEPCWYAIKKSHNHNWQGSRKESTVWEIPNLSAFGKSNQEDERTAHSTQKPLECMAKPIKNNTSKGEGVYDPFLGSGTTLIAAEQLDRICYGIELSPAYCDIIVSRYINLLGKKGLNAIIKRNGELISHKEFITNFSKDEPSSKTY